MRTRAHLGHVSHGESLEIILSNENCHGEVEVAVKSCRTSASRRRGRGMSWTEAHSKKSSKLVKFLYRSSRAGIVV